MRAIVLGVAVLIAHVLALQWLLAARHVDAVLKEQVSVPLMVLRLAPPPDSRRGSFGPQIPARVPPLVTLPPTTAPLQFPTIITQDPAADALRDYLSCASPDDLRRSAEERRRCESRLPPRTALPDRDDTLSKKFARDLAVQNAPLLMPCFGPAGLSLVCLMGSAVNGFSANSYADQREPRDRMRSAPLPRDGSIAGRARP